MQISYAALNEAAASLQSAASHLSGEVRPAELGSGATAVENAHISARNARSRALSDLATLMRAQGSACTELIALFRALDAQIAAHTEVRSDG